MKCLNCIELNEIVRNIALVSFGVMYFIKNFKDFTGHLSSLLFQTFFLGHLDQAIIADQCTQYGDGFGIAANNTTDHTRNLRGFFQSAFSKQD